MTRRPRRLLALALVPLLSMGVAACGDDDEDDAASPSGSASEAPAEDGDDGDDGEGGDNTVHIEEVEYGYEISGSLSEGWATLEFENAGEEYHMAGFGRLKEGVTFDDVMEVMESQGPGGDEGDHPSEEPEEQTLGEIRLASQEGESEEEGPPADEAPEGEGEDEGGDPLAAVFEEELGAPGHLLAPGESVAITTDVLTAGTYAVICFLPTPDGEAHVAKGMISELTVEESDEPVGEEPEADAELSFGGGEVTGADGEVTAGETTFAVSGTGGTHEFAIARTDDESVTFEELDEHFTQFDETGPPTKENLEDGPGVLELYLFDYPEGQTTYITVDLDAGSYYVGCGYEEDDAGEHKEFVQMLVT